MEALRPLQSALASTTQTVPVETGKRTDARSVTSLAAHASTVLPLVTMGFSTKIFRPTNRRPRDISSSSWFIRRRAAAAWVAWHRRNLSVQRDVSARMAEPDHARDHNRAPALVLFSSALGSRMAAMDGVSFGSFIVLGLLAVVFMQSFFNASFGVFSQVYRYNLQTLSAPISVFERF